MLKIHMNKCKGKETMETKSHNLQNLELFGDSFFRKALHVEKQIEVTYNKNLIQIGRKKNGGIFYLDMKEPKRIIVVGQTGSGKTFMVREILNRWKFAEWSIFIPTDIKDEFHSNCRPVQKKFRHLLLPGEKPNAEKVIILRPTFFKQINPDLNPDTNNVWYSPDLTKMNKADFMTFFRFSELQPAQQAAVEYLFKRFEAQLKIDPNNFDFKSFDEWISEVPEISAPTEKSLRLRFASLYDSNFYDPKCRLNLAKLINEGYTIGINLDGFEGFMQGNFQYVHAIISVTVRELIQARRVRKIKRLAIFLEEAPRFIANTMPTSSVRIITEESFEVDRKFGVDWLVVTQDFSQLSDRVINNSQYIFVPANISSESFYKIFTRLGMFTSIQNARNEANRYFRQMSQKNHEWGVFCINDKENPFKIFTPLAPLTEHAEAIE